MKRKEKDKKTRNQCKAISLTTKESFLVSDENVKWCSFFENKSKWKSGLFSFPLKTGTQHEFTNMHLLSIFHYQCKTHTHRILNINSESYR